MGKEHDDLHHKAKRKLFDFARQNRQGSTPAEAFLWQYLRNGQINGLKIRRQHPIADFIADFYCHSCKVVIEVDGGYHFQQEQNEHDQGRKFELEEKGITVLRFSNEEVLSDINAVLQELRKHLTLNPSPGGEGL